MLKKWILFGVCGVMICLSTSLVWGHGSIERTDPIDGSEVKTVPSRIRVWFSEALVTESGKISVITDQGEIITPLKVYQSEVAPNLLIADLPPDLKPALYIVMASGVVVSDGHEPQGSFTFRLLAPVSLDANTPITQSAYEMVALFMGLLIIGGLISYGMFHRRVPLDITIRRPPSPTILNWINYVN